MTEGTVQNIVRKWQAQLHDYLIFDGSLKHQRLRIREKKSPEKNSEQKVPWKKVPGKKKWSPDIRFLQFGVSVCAVGGISR